MKERVREDQLVECRKNAVEWTRELVRLKSENPPGNELAPARFCEGILRGIGMDVTFDEFEPNRVNVIAYAGNRADVGIVLYGHLDVVTAAGEWTHAPFSAELIGDEIWGRGSADMKSGCAAVMAAVKATLTAGPAPDKGICVLLVADEENTNKGCKRLQKTTQLKADACVVAEPTGLQVHYGNRGYTSFFIRTYGEACHASEPKAGKNAIYAMARVIQKLEVFADVLAERKNSQLGCMSLSVGTIRGGVNLNTVPAFCEIEVEVRVFPDMDAYGIRKELQALLGDEAEVIVRSNLLASLVPEDSGIVKAASECVSEVIGKEAVIARFPACSEASYFSVGYGIPTILLGPGDIGLAHKIDERVPVKQIEDAVDIYASLIRRYSEKT